MTDAYDIVEVVAHNVKLYRKAKHMTTLQLAEESNLSVSYISSLENHHRDNISISTVSSLAAALRITTDELIHPIVSGRYTESPAKFDEDECEEVVRKQDILRTYYPPIMASTRISCMMELVVILPLLDVHDVYDIYLHIGGTTSDYEEYISEIIERAWNKVPYSPAKRFAENELYKIRNLRFGFDSHAIEIESKTFDSEGCKQYNDRLQEKYKLIQYLKFFMEEKELFFNSNE